MSVTASLAHLALAALAMLAIASALALALRSLRRDPISGYRAARVALLAALLVPGVEFLAASRWIEIESPRLDRIVDRAITDERAAPSRIEPFAAATNVSLASESARTPRGPQAPDLPSSEATGVRIEPAIAEAITSTHENAGGPIVPRNAQLAIVALYLAGAFIALWRSFARARRTRAFLRRCEPLAPERLSAILHGISANAAAVRFQALVSDEIETPCCAGVMKRRVVLPARDLAPEADTQRVAFALLHEAVHLERRDPAALVAQRAMLVVFWFHPAAHWLSRTLDALRELSCDREVVARTGRGKSYARALLDYAAAPSSPPAVLDATAMFDRTRRRSLLARRIEMLSCDRRDVSKSKKLVIAAVSGSTLAAVVAFQVAVGSALPAFAGEGESLVAYCPPKKTTPECDALTAPDNSKGRGDRQAPRKDLKTPKGKPASPEEKNERLRELLASKRNDASDPIATYVSTAFSTQRQEDATLDPEVKRALIKTLLRDDHSTARSTAAAALAPFLKEKEVKDAFMSALRDGRDSRLKITVLDELLKREALSDDARELFVRLFAMDNAEYQRISLTEALAPYANEPDARDALIEALLDDANQPMQLESALALASHAGDSAVLSAMNRVLLGSGNEVARLVIIDALATQAAANEQVRRAFVEVLVKDDSAIARLRVADRLAEHADDPNVRKTMIDALNAGVSALIQSRLVDGLAPHVLEPDVKRGFIAMLDRVNDEVVKLRLVSSLAGVADATRSAADSPGAVPLLDVRDSNGRTLPIVGPR